MKTSITNLQCFLSLAVTVLATPGCTIGEEANREDQDFGVINLRANVQVRQETQKKGSTCEATLDVLTFTGVEPEIARRLNERFVSRDLLQYARDCESTPFVVHESVSIVLNGGGLLSGVRYTTTAVGQNAVEEYLEPFTYDLRTGNFIALTDAVGSRGIRKMLQSCILAYEAAGVSSADCDADNEVADMIFYDVVEQDGIRIFQPFSRFKEIGRKGQLVPWIEIKDTLIHPLYKGLAYYPK